MDRGKGYYVWGKREDLLMVRLGDLLGKLAHDEGREAKLKD